MFRRFFLTLCLQCIFAFPVDNITYNGDLMIGGLFPIHGADRKSFVCTKETKDQFVIDAEATHYAIKAINRLKRTGVSFGYEFYDTCGIPFVASQKASKWLDVNDNDPQPIRIVTGSLGSDESIPVSVLLQTPQIPFLSQLGVSDNLLEMGAQPMTIQLSPQNYLQAKALVALLNHMNWKSIILISNNDPDSTSLANDLIESATNPSNNICINYEFQFSVWANPANNKNGLLKISKYQGVVVLIAHEEGAKFFFTTLEGSSILTDYQFIANNGWVLWHMNFTKHINGTIGIVPFVPGYYLFYLYLKFLTLQNACHNPWMVKLISQQNDCQPSICYENVTIKNFTKLCKGSEQLKMSQTSISTESANRAIFTIKLIERSLIDLCKSKGLTENSECRQLIFTLSGNDLFFILNKTAASMIHDRCNFNVFQFDSRKESWKPAGAINACTDNVSVSIFADRLNNRSQKWCHCKYRCQSLEYPLPTNGLNTCCSNCSRCDDSDMKIRHGNCVFCAKIDDSMNNSCVNMTPITLDVKQPAVIMQLALIGFGCCLSIIVLLLFIYERNSPLLTSILPVATIALPFCTSTSYLTAVFYLVLGDCGIWFCIIPRVVWCFGNVLIWTLFLCKIVHLDRFEYQLLTMSNEPVKMYFQCAKILGLVTATLVVTSVVLVCLFLIVCATDLDTIHVYEASNLWVVCPCKNSPKTLISYIPKWVLCIAVLIMCNRNRDSHIWIICFEAQLIYYLGILSLLSDAVLLTVHYTASSVVTKGVISLVSILTSPSIIQLIYLCPVAFNLIWHRSRNTREFLYRRNVYRRVNGSVLVMMTLEELQSRSVSSSSEQ